MPRNRHAEFEELRALVPLFREQLSLLQESNPEAYGPFMGAIDLRRCDDVLAKGPTAPWPPGLLGGLREAVRDLFTMLDDAYHGERRAAAYARLRALGGAAVGAVQARDAKLLASVRKRGRIRDESEYYLVRNAADQAEVAIPRDEALLHELWGLLDEAGAGGSA